MTRKAIFWGGPCDGKAMLLSEDKHPYILLPIIDRSVQPVAMFDPVDQPSLGHWKVARYEWVPLHWREHAPESMCDIYMFRGVDR